MENEWKIPDEAEEESEEQKEDFEEEPEEELENIIQETPTSFVRKADAEQINPFLEQEPIEAVDNLEQDLQDVPVQTNEDEEEQPVLYNAPQYQSAYDAGYEVMEEQRRQTDPEMTTGTLMRGETEMREIGGLQERRIDFHRWQQSHMEPGQRQAQSQQENYIREPAKFKEQDKLPFQRKRKRGQF